MYFQVTDSEVQICFDDEQQDKVQTHYNVYPQLTIWCASDREHND